MKPAAEHAFEGAWADGTLRFTVESSDTAAPPALAARPPLRAANPSIRY